MNVHFADASYWIALFNPRDRSHARALEISTARPQKKIVTSELVLTEFLDYFSEKGPLFREKVARTVTELRSDPNVIVERLNSRNFGDAVALYGRRLDKGWGLTDCSSSLYIRKRGIGEVLTHDLHFKQMGFVPLLREE